MATYTTYDMVGRKEDVSDIITDISPTDTPFFTMVKPETVDDRVFYWQEDELDPPANNAKVEGHDPNDATLSPTTMRSNTCQILEKTFKISRTSDRVAKYGRKKETAYQLGKKLKEIKRDLEKAMIGVDNASVTGNNSTAREMSSISQMISTTVDAGSNTTDPLTESKLLELGQTCFENGSDPTVFMIKPADSLLVANFAAATGRNREIRQERKIVNVVDFYISPFSGEDGYKVVVNRWNLSTHAFLIDPTMFRVNVLDPFQREVLAKTGDAQRHMIVGEYSCSHKNFADSGMITGLS